MDRWVCISSHSEDSINSFKLPIRKHCVCVILLLLSGILLFPGSLENTDTNKISKIKTVGMDIEFLMDHFSSLIKKCINFFFYWAGIMSRWIGKVRILIPCLSLYQGQIHGFELYMQHSFNVVKDCECCRWHFESLLLSWSLYIGKVVELILNTLHLV